ncbi:MAG: hypothetical protein NDI94_06220 [Candidatus Woesearchaeota archaeon]|nr:hypothetical protein [Candidatus Woesearchaeota archaeon]
MTKIHSLVTAALNVSDYRDAMRILNAYDDERTASFWIGAAKIALKWYDNPNALDFYSEAAKHDATLAERAEALSVGSIAYHRSNCKESREKVQDLTRQLLFGQDKGFDAAAEEYKGETLFIRAMTHRNSGHYIDAVVDLLHLGQKIYMEEQGNKIITTPAEIAIHSSLMQILMLNQDVYLKVDGFKEGTFGELMKDYGRRITISSDTPRLGSEIIGTGILNGYAKANGLAFDPALIR